MRQGSKRRPPCAVGCLSRVKRESGESPEQSRCCKSSTEESVAPCATARARSGGKADGLREDKPEDLPQSTEDSRGRANETKTKHRIVAGDGSHVRPRYGPNRHRDASSVARGRHLHVARTLSVALHRAFPGRRPRAHGANRSRRAERRRASHGRRGTEGLWRRRRHQDRVGARAGQPVHVAHARRRGGQRLPERASGLGTLPFGQQRLCQFRQRAGRAPAADGTRLRGRQRAEYGDGSSRFLRQGTSPCASRTGGRFVWSLVALSRVGSEVGTHAVGFGLGQLSALRRRLPLHALLRPFPHGA